MLIIETGVGIAGAESYASIDQADARCASLGVVAWSSPADVDKEIALRKATIFMGQNYRMQWAGRRLLRTQSLDWPRYGVSVDGFPVLTNTVPPEVVAACIDLAVRSAAGEELLPDLEIGNNQVKRERIGPIDTDYFENNTNARERFVAIDAMLEPFFGGAGGGATMKLVRA